MMWGSSPPPLMKQGGPGARGGSSPPQRTTPPLPSPPQRPSPRPTRPAPWRVPLWPLMLLLLATLVGLTYLMLPSGSTPALDLLQSAPVGAGGAGLPPLDGASGPGGRAGEHLAPAAAALAVSLRHRLALLHRKPPATAPARQLQQQGGPAAAAAEGGARPGQATQGLPSPWEQLQGEEGEGGAPRSPPRYSHYSCVGRKFDDDFHRASCAFRNVCLNTSSWEVEFYSDPSFPLLPVSYDQVGRGMLYFYSPFLHPGHARVEEELDWRPTTVVRPFPEGAHVKWAPTPVAVLTTLPPALLANIGHILFDVLAPLFSLMNLFRSYSYDSQVLIWRAQGGSEEELEAGRGRFLNPPPSAADRSLLRLLSRYPALRLQEYAAEQGVAPGELLCFKRLLAGTGTLNRQMDRIDALPFRQAAMHNLGLAEAEAEPQREPVITIFNKRGRRSVENMDEISSAIQERYPAVQVRLIDFSSEESYAGRSWGVPRTDGTKMSWREQARLLSETTILISPCGGLATPLMLMRPGATAITVNYWNTEQQRSFQLEELYYRNLEYLDLHYFPVVPEDYQGTTDRPWCELIKGGGRYVDAPYDQLGALVHCNVRIQDISRMLNFVDRAMLRWASENARYDILPVWPAKIWQQQHEAALRAAPGGAAAGNPEAEAARQRMADAIERAAAGVAAADA